jgi:hypothetical protein
MNVSWPFGIVFAVLLTSSGASAATLPLVCRIISEAPRYSPSLNLLRALDRLGEDIDWTHIKDQKTLDKITRIAVKALVVEPLTFEEKVRLWDIFIAELKSKIFWQQFKYNAADGSVIYSGVFHLLVIRPDGAIYKGFSRGRSWPKEGMTVNYSDLVRFTKDYYETH